MLRFQVIFDGLKAAIERQRVLESHMFDLEAGRGDYACGIRADAFEKRVAAGMILDAHHRCSARKGSPFTPWKLCSPSNVSN